MRRSTWRRFHAYGSSDGAQFLMIQLRAPAKVNLYLRVVGRRPDGYHELETVFERIDLADELTFEPAEALTLTCDDAALSCGEDNLVIKAARLLHAGTGQRRGARMHLRKRIPIAAGLGGGSSDAAAALVGLTQLWRLELSRERLFELAATLGADVPFFLTAAPWMIARGRGELFEPIAARLGITQLLVWPGEPLSTKEVFAGWEFDLTGLRPSISMMAHALSNGSLSELATGLWNDLQPEAIRRCPVIQKVHSSLQESGCLAAVMSGSGPSVVGLCRDRDHAQEIASRIRRSAPASWRLDIVRTDIPSLMTTSELAHS